MPAFEHASDAELMREGANGSDESLDLLYRRFARSISALALTARPFQPRHRDPVFARDGWRCAVPACSARRALHDHHVVFRSQGGDNAR